MANTSTLDLVKPAGTDYALVSTINGNMDKIDAEAAKERGNFAGTYSTSSAYAVGAYCIYQGNLYRCTTAIGSGGEAWTAGHWAQVSVGNVLTSLKDQMANIEFKNKLAEQLTEADNINLFGEYIGRGNSCHGLPTTDATYYFLICLWNTQIAIDSDNSHLYKRIYINNAWTSWDDQIAASYDSVAYAKLTDIQSALGTIAASLPVDQTKFIRIHTGTDTSLAPFTAWNDFIGYMQRQSTNYWIATLVGRDGVDVTVTCSNGTLRTYSLSSKIMYQDFTCNMASYSGATKGDLITALNTTKDITLSGYTPIAITMTDYPSSTYNVGYMISSNSALIRCYAVATTANATVVKFRVMYIKT